MEIINAYCDESCHLANDGQKKMVLGTIWCPTEKARPISKRIFEFKAKHGIGHDTEFKWSKVSKNKINFYLDLVDYFFDDDDLHFRGLIVEDKSTLDHERFKQTHDDWYYKMYFTLLKVILDPEKKYRIYLDIKDTRSADKVRNFHDILSKSIYDFDRRIVERVQNIRSHESAIMQLNDLILGALSHFQRSEGRTDTGSEWKLKVIERIKQRSGKSLTRSTLYRESKFNIFFWSADSAAPSSL